MNKALNFYKRNLKEIFRDPIIYIFCLGFPFVMFLLFRIINEFSNGQTPTFEVNSLLPGIIVFSYSFIMLTLALIVSKDRQTFFLKRLYSSPMKFYHFILGYFLVGLLIGLLQTAVCVATAFFISLTTTAEFIPIGSILLLTVAQLPMLIMNIFLGILFGTVFNDKTSPGICSVLISVAGILGGCWMPVEAMGGFEVFCRFLPYYPSVYIGRIITNSTNALGVAYSFDSVAILGLIPISAFMIISILLTVFAFKKSMVSDE
ncbi:MAG: ABC transporter permease [Clostridiales bacterium]|nr:ABC transporter permease [Clostridiales bacterium]